MTAPACAEAAPSLAALRDAGAQRLDPVRFRYLEALSSRLDSVHGEARTLVQRRLQQALADYAARFELAQQAAASQREMQRGMPRHAAPAAAERPLAALNRYLRERTRDAGDGAPNAEFDAEFGTPTGAEMKSVRRFRQAWSRIAAEDQVEQAAGRGPVNAGPLNSHMLVLRSLELMRGLSPDYLQHFLSQADALLWLEQAQQKASAPAKPARRSGPRKS